MENIHIIDLFAGPGGLGEGFCSYEANASRPFSIAISIEKETFAHQTLMLRSFYRQFTTLPKTYYEYLKEHISRDELFARHPQEAAKAQAEACQIELGSPKFPHSDIIRKIKSNIRGKQECIIIGGPPCQAYSLVGRSKMSKREGFGNDPRHTLYREYLKILAECKPAVFVMENVKGILSSKLNNELVFDRILNDLRKPQKALEPTRTRFRKTDSYTIYSLTSETDPAYLKNSDFVIRAEDYGIPQARHRVILLGVRNDITVKPKCLKPVQKRVTVADVIDDLPRLRSGLSKADDNYDAWKQAIKSYDPNFGVHNKLERGQNYLPIQTKPKVYERWYCDPAIKGTLNHSTRAHIVSDLHRYYYAAAFTQKNNVSPNLAHFPKNLLPNHKNADLAISSKSLFTDRFKVQASHKPANTITSHISKDGHYFIHYDPKQCRSLTVREAARIQTFPDNYKFEGPRTSQYQQVGNAVPPLLAKQIAEIVYDLLANHKTKS